MVRKTSNDLKKIFTRNDLAARKLPKVVIICTAQSYLTYEQVTMTAPSPHELTQLLLDWSKGNKAALDQLMPLVYDELRRLAHHYLRRERAGHTLQTTALVNEAYLRLIDQRCVQWQNRAHFFGVASQLMRRILVDHARARHYVRRGGGARRVSLDEALVVSKQRAADVLALDEALTALATIDRRKSQIVEMRFFGGLSIEETAEVLAVSPGTIMRDWTLAKAWLHREISKEA
jgi:RNA polymerase sigma factor (TIGR02999 family)